jgi:3-oxoadipate enol-lactonase
LVHQLKAVQGHDTWEELPNIQNPTLVIAGKEDILIPPENSKILAERIPNARLRILERGGHQFLIEHPEVFNNALLEFLMGLPKQS